MASNNEIKPSGTSRRTALKAGVATGVGLVAWSAPSITSLGGTPVYAAGCTFVQKFDLTGCRNTTQGTCSGPFRYQPLTPPSGFTFANNNFNNECCDAGRVVTISWTANIECKATVALTEKNQCGQKPAYASVSYGPSTSPLAVPLTCVVPGPPYSAFQSDTFYDISLSCNSVGAPPSCL